MISAKRDTKRTAATLVGLILLAPVFPVAELEAADEDTSASVYLVFDPETGEFLTVDDPARTQQHIADQEAIVSGVTPGSDGTGAAGSGDATPMALTIVAALAALLSIGGYLWFKRGRRGEP